MQILTLIPSDSKIYFIASLVNLILGSFFISNHIYERWLKKLNLIDINLMIKGAIVFYGFLYIYPETLFHGNEIRGCILGIAIGYFFLKFEIACIRSSFFMKINKFSLPLNQNSSANFTVKNILTRNRNISPVNKFNYSYYTTFLVGIFEEIIYRGYLTILCLSLPQTFLSIIGLLLVNIFFAFSHIYLGYVHVFSKFILGLLCLISFLASASIMMPLAIHGTFNILAVKRLRELQYA